MHCGIGLCDFHPNLILIDKISGPGYPDTLMTRKKTLNNEWK